VCKKVGGLGGVEAFKVRSPRYWPITVREVSEAWQDPLQLDLSDMSSHLLCKRGKPPVPPENENPLRSVTSEIHSQAFELVLGGPCTLQGL
jgi:hypothetical protein